MPELFENYIKTYNDFLALSNLCVKNHSDSKEELVKSLKRTESFMEFIGSPHKKLNIIHVAGTSGKGSVCYTLHQILTNAGLKTGTYLSPHTTTYLERFLFGNNLISTDHLIASVKKLTQQYQKYLSLNGDPLSFFELSTCLALFMFYKTGAKWCVLEAGCGGRWDATNIIPTPRIAVITNINKDHTELLGKTLSKIAYEKAGIIKPNGIVICGETRSSLKKIFENEAIKNKSTIFFVNNDHSNIVDDSFGSHQQHNVAIARCAAQIIGIDEKCVKTTFKNLKQLPCRFEKIQNKPLIILDGAHSPAKIAATAKQIRELNKSVHIIFGCAANKDSETMIKLLSPVSSKITTTRFKVTERKSANPVKLLNLVPRSKQAGAFLDHEDALKNTILNLKNNEAIVITGSLFLSGEMRKNWINEKQIIKAGSSFPV
jgi:dihydrofolate synthase/folylpolyglutamate synthase